MLVYGFHKVSHLEDNAHTKAEPQIAEYEHPDFRRDHKELLCKIQRKGGKEPGSKESIDYKAMLAIMNEIRQQNATLSQDLKRVQADNLALWQEQSDTRARHAKHQETIDKILAFLGSVYGNQRHDDKVIRPKKRKLLLQPDIYEESASLDSVFDDDRTKETFDEMFRSASSSPVLRPLRQPATEVASEKSAPVQQVENRYTMPKFEASQHNDSLGTPAQSSHDGTRGESNYYQSASSTFSTDQANDNMLALNNAQSPWNRIQDLLMPLPDTSGDTESTQLTLLPEDRIMQNVQRTQEIESDIQTILANQDRKLNSIAKILHVTRDQLDSWNANPPDTSNPEWMNNVTLGDPGTSDFDFDSILNDDSALPYDFDTHSVTNLEGGIIDGLDYEDHTPTPKIRTADPTPSPPSMTSSIHEEHVEEVDMGAKAKERQKNK